MNKLIQTNRLAFIVIICSALMFGCATSHTVEGYFGRVIDSNTRIPLEGAVILAIYSTNTRFDLDINDPSIIHSETACYSTLNPLAAQETITDKNGEFKITEQQLRKKGSANLVIFKPGYGNYPVNHVVYVHYPEYHGPKGSNKAYVQRSSGYIPPGKYVTIELPLLSSKQARTLNIPAVNFNIPYEKQINFLSAISKELYLLDLPIFYSHKYFKKELW